MCENMLKHYKTKLDTKDWPINIFIFDINMINLYLNRRYLILNVWEYVKLL